MALASLVENSKLALRGELRRGAGQGGGGAVGCGLNAFDSLCTIFQAQGFGIELKSVRYPLVVDLGVVSNAKVTREVAGKTNAEPLGISAVRPTARTCCGH